MTDLGRESGSGPWHPQDPLYGDPEWAGQGAPPGDWGQHGAPYQPGQQSWDGAAPSALHGPDQGDPYGQAGPYAPADGGYGPPSQTGGHRWPGPYQPDPYGGQEGYAYQGRQPPAAYAQPDPYGGPGPHGGDPYGLPEPRPRQAASHDQTTAYPPGERQRFPYRDGPDPDGLPDDEPEQAHPFFSDDDPDDGEFPNDGGRGRKKDQKRRGRTRRSGCACLGVLLVLGGGVGTVGYLGYEFYQSRFGPAPDYRGGGTGEVQVEIPKGAFTADIGKILHNHGVVKSTEAFVEAAQRDDRAARSIQPGVYTLKKRMSAASALKILTDTANLNTLTIPEGWRATQVYAAVDKKLGLEKGTTKDVARKTDLGLPGFAKGNPEGFLYPSRYSVGRQTKPAELLRQMVRQARGEYRDDGLEGAAKGVGRTPYEVITIASIIQAEAQEAKDFGKVSRVIYNRLDTQATNGRLDMDSTINYALNRSSLDTSAADTRLDSPYNTYRNRGLPPGPIGNPGHQAVKAALNPTKGPWIYFVTVRRGDTRFTADKAEHDRNVAEFNRNQREQGNRE